MIEWHEPERRSVHSVDYRQSETRMYGEMSSSCEYGVKLELMRRG